MKKAALIAYIFFALLNVVGHIMIATDWFAQYGVAMTFLSKPMLMIILFIYFFWSVIQKDWLNEDTKIAFALVAAWFGDVFLMFNGMEYFLAGVGSFFVMQILYINNFTTSGQLYADLLPEQAAHNALIRRCRKTGEPIPKDRPNVIIEPEEKLGLLQQKPWLSIPLLILAIIICWVVLPRLGEDRVLQGAVIVYAFTIIYMVMMAINRGERVNKESFWMVLIGSILFLISDFTIAINAFVFVDFPFASVIIMGLYIPAQYFIVEGYLRQEKVNVP